MTTKRNVKNAYIMSRAVLLAVMFGYQAEAPGRMAYPEGSAHFITQIYAIWYGKNNDGADPGMSIARKTIIKGDQSIKF